MKKSRRFVRNTHYLSGLVCLSGWPCGEEKLVESPYSIKWRKPSEMKLHPVQQAVTGYGTLLLLRPGLV